MMAFQKLVERMRGVTSRCLPSPIQVEHMCRYFLNAITMTDRPSETSDKKEADPCSWIQGEGRGVLIESQSP